MIVIVGEVRGQKAAELLSRLGWGRMAVDAYFRPYPGEPWGFDNGAFRDWKRGRPFGGVAAEPVPTSPRVSWTMPGEYRERFHRYEDEIRAKLREAGFELRDGEITEL